MADDIIKGIPINSKGYGTIPKLVMQDKNMSIGAKAVYAYFNSYAGGGDQCFPSRQLMCSDLCISKQTLTKYINELKDNGYITYEQIKENGRFSHNVYTLLGYKLPCTKISDSEETVYQNLGTNNNSYNNNNNNINNNKDIYNTVVKKFNDICISLPHIIGLNNTRKATIKARLKEYSLEQIEEVFRKAENSDFLTGKVSNKGQRPFKASFDWLMKPSNFIKVLEGNYDNRQQLSDFGLVGADERYRGIQII